MKQVTFRRGARLKQSRCITVGMQKGWSRELLSEDREMLRMSMFSALFLSAIAAPVLAEEVTMTRAIEAGSLHEGRLDMVAYYLPTADGKLEVTATFAAHEAMAGPMRIVMAMRDGDTVAFAMPGYRDAQYSFSRAGAEINIAVDAKQFSMAGY